MQSEYSIHIWLHIYSLNMYMYMYVYILKVTTCNSCWYNLGKMSCLLWDSNIQHSILGSKQLSYQWSLGGWVQITHTCTRARQVSQPDIHVVWSTFRPWGTWWSSRSLCFSSMPNIFTTYCKPTTIDISWKQRRQKKRITFVSMFFGS